MSTSCGRPQGEERRVSFMRTHVDRGRGSKTWIFYGRHHWMAFYCLHTLAGMKCMHL